MAESTTPKAGRSLPIPKEVNHFLINEIAASYYSSHCIQQKSEILKQVESQLKGAGYTITANGVERRLKNMKSHYRRKKAEILMGIQQGSPMWEYFDALDAIFSKLDQIEAEKLNEKKKAEELKKHELKDQASTSAASIGQPQLKKISSITHNNSFDAHSSSPTVIPGNFVECHIKEETNGVFKRPPESQQHDAKLEPEDLSVKRAKLIEFSDKEELIDKIPTQKSAEEQKAVESCQEVVKKIINSIKAVDARRVMLDQQRITLEIRRYELDIVGYHLSEMLYKLTHPPAPTQNAAE